jgi:hypothetical protein
MQADVTNIVEHKKWDYDPMIYDVMRESATRLGGKYIALARKASTVAEKEALYAADRGIQQEADMVDSGDVHAVEAKTRDFSERLSLIRRSEEQEPRKVA